VSRRAGRLSRHDLECSAFLFGMGFGRIHCCIVHVLLNPIEQAKDVESHDSGCSQNEQKSDGEQDAKNQHEQIHVRDQFFQSRAAGEEKWFAAGTESVYRKWQHKSPSFRTPENAFRSW
jgi:hypothetical protein